MWSPTLKVKNVSKSYDSLQVLKNISFEINRGEKIAFVGKNGEGKTTLAKVIVSAVDYDGRVQFGYNVKFGYYAQNQVDFLDTDKTVFQTIEDAMTGDVNLKIRDILGSFLFSNDDVNKKIGVLSGGERARVSLCKLLLSPVNFLVMDEPTNHLDIMSKDILKRALMAFDGTLIIISHDRDFLEGLSNKIYEFEKRQIREYLGDVSNFLQSKQLDNLNELEQKKVNSTIVVKKVDSKEKISYKKRKELDRKIRKLENKISRIEEEISAIETQKKEWDIKLSDPEQFKELSKEKDFFFNYESLKKKLIKKETEWDVCVSELNDLKKE